MRAQESTKQHRDADDPHIVGTTMADLPEKHFEGSSAVHEKGRGNVHRIESQGDIRESTGGMKSMKLPVGNRVHPDYTTENAINV